MNALYQRLKELNGGTFEQLCFHVLRERHPSSCFRRVEGASGDDGADVFVGDLEGGPTVWQAKAFPKGVSASQKDQIRKSLNRAVIQLEPRCWILCLNIDLDIRAYRWWEHLKKSYATKVDIGLWQASDIVNELPHRKTISELFFPNAALNISELKALVIGTASQTNAGLSALAQETSEQLLERLKARDARFNCQLVVSPENTPVSSPPDTLFSISKGRTTISAVARDVRALKLDPPRFTFQVKGTGLNKVRAFMETGSNQTFASHEFGSVSTTLGGIDFFETAPEARSLVMSSPNHNRSFPARLTFGTATEQVVYEYLPFKIIRMGSKEVELLFEGNGPMEITLLFREDNGDLKFRQKTLGFSVRSADKWLRALELLKSGGPFEIFDLSTERRYLTDRVTVEADSSSLVNNADFFREATELCDRFGVELELNRPLTEIDVEAYIFLRPILEGATVDVGRITGKMEKRSDVGFSAQLLDGEPRQLRLDCPGASVALLDSNVQTGPYSLTVEVILLSAESAFVEWQAAAEGSLIELTWEALRPAKISSGIEH